MKRAALLLAALGICAATNYAHADLKDRRSKFPQDSDVLYLPAPSQLKTMSLGYSEALADLIWIRAVVFAGTKRNMMQSAWVGKYLEAIVELSPQFNRPYKWGGVIYVYTGQPITRQMIDRALEIYREGLSRFPEDHELLFATGMLLYRDVPNDPGYSTLERDSARAEGIEMIRKSASFGASPLIRQLAATLVAQTSTASDQLAIQFLENQLIQAEDDGYKRVLRDKLRTLGGRLNSSELDRLRHRMNSEKSKNFAYLPTHTYALMRLRTE